MRLMHRASIVAAALALATVTGFAANNDKIHVIDKDSGSDKIVVGRIMNTTANEVTIELKGGISDQVQVNEIKFIQWDNEPAQMSQAHKYIHEGDFGEALASLEKADLEDVKRPEMKLEHEYLMIYCQARLALAGSLTPEDGKDPLKESGKRLVAFLTANASTYHFYEANELVGDLLVASGNYAAAEPYYNALKQAKWPDYKMRAGVAMGRALLAQEKAAEAAKAFDEVIASEGASELAEGQRRVAKLGKARCLAATGQADAAIKMIEEVIAKADNDELNAQAYNALGFALRKAKKPKEALLAFLHTDLLYPSSPDAHAEALANLVALFREQYKPVHSKRARATLLERYGSSHWAASVKKE
jgi:tetratricopeptide (TPR) repeat protein